MFCFQNYSCLIALLCCCSELAAITSSITSAHTSPSVPIISSSSSSIIRHLEWSWKLAFHPGVMGNTRPSTPGSRYAPYALRAPHPRGRVAVFTTLVATARAVTLPLHSACRSALRSTRTPPGARATCSARELRLTSGLAAPVASLLPRSETTHMGYFWLWDLLRLSKVRYRTGLRCATPSRARVPALRDKTIITLRRVD